MMPDSENPGKSPGPTEQTPEPTPKPVTASANGASRKQTDQSRLGFAIGAPLASAAPSRACTQRWKNMPAAMMAMTCHERSAPERNGCDGVHDVVLSDSL